jgi:cytochrome c556
MTRTLRITKKLTLLTGMILALGAVAHADGYDPIETRKAAMDLVSVTFANIKSVVTTNGDVKTLEGPAKAIKRYAMVHPTLFPAGSGTGDTKAAPAIWTDPAGFQKSSTNMANAADALAIAAKAGDATAAAAAFKQMGEACGACHKDYRLK